MQVRATSSFNYQWRLAVIGGVCFLFSLWCLYDGLVAYPAHNVKANKFIELQEAGRLEEWEPYAESQGWSTDEPDAPKGDLSIATQFLMAGITMPIGLLFGFSFFRYRGRWVEANDDGLDSSWTGPIPWDAIKDMDVSRWRSKGIAVVSYQRDKGEAGRLILDDWKYEREATDEIFKRVEEHLGLTPEEEPNAGAPEHGDGAGAEARAGDAAEASDDPSASDKSNASV